MFENWVWDAKAIIGVGCFIIAVIALIASRLPKFIESERYKILIEAGKIKDKDLTQMQGNVEARDYWLEQKPDKEQKTLRRQYDLYLIREKLKFKHLNERYFSAVKWLNAWLTRVLDGDKADIALAEDSKWSKHFGVNPFTPNSYRFCLVLAVGYPLAMALMVWLFSEVFTLPLNGLWDWADGVLTVVDGSYKSEQ